MAIKVSFTVPVLAAIVVGEIFSFVWFRVLELREYDDRNLITGIIGDIGLAVLLDVIVRDYWRVWKWQDAGHVAIWLTLLYASLQGPHEIWGPSSLWVFFVVCLHKMILIFVMTLALHYAKKRK